ncbi:MAG: hypothetical protein IPO07_29455 [Haliscomenobacter sp.]|uniref:DUF4142 domain-containing protein n=1 Tax=Haliscomenobacter hydrossis (strain ATCC 27775 / DSM 1100 / LMG 10767 / O) TaxID=760192 RepID=F4L1Q3_HALH1|nr:MULTISPECIES: hypothetical protein [Haliscomenobacter]AEE49562.1 hypothetical protein Halhy_1673 [Haliscomenobacter hydrossis DSM 1100]MBK9492456.1 hypothetical protein [Haliscomenobacter sp.]
MTKLYFGILALVLCSTALPAQDVYIGLRQFLDTKFMQEYVKSRDESERAVRRFKRTQSRYTEEQVLQVADAYNNSAEQFNQMLYNIKDDLLHKEKRKFLVLFPEDYSKQVECDLYRARDFYSKNFQKALVEVSGDGTETSSFLTLLPTLIEYGKSAFALFTRIKEEIQKYNEALLKKYLIDEYRFRHWDEIN